MTVWLVGAGPGDPGLLTRRGAEVLARAEVVVHDRLANPVLLELAPANAVRISVGKAPGYVEMTQEQINAVLVEHGLTGARVVRLKGGDPFVFGRGGEEAEALANAGVTFEIVPGITSAIAAAAYAGVPVTHRGVSTHFTVVTGHEDPTKGHTDVDWEALGAVGGTIVILMGAARLPDIAARLLRGGRSPSTPVIAVRSGTLPTQHSVRMTLGDLRAVKAPSAIIVGDVAALDFGWFEHRPLFGRRIVVTRAREQASEMTVRLTELGATVIEIPAITIEPVAVTVPDLADYQWVVFTSTNAVVGFWESGLTPAGLDARALGGVRVAAIGPGTAAALASRGVVPDLVPERFVAEALVDAFPIPGRVGVLGGARVLIARAEVAPDVLPEGLSNKGYHADVLPTYRTVPVELSPATAADLRTHGADAITFTSSSTVTNFLSSFGALTDFAAPAPKVISIGPITSATAVEQGLSVSAEASESTIEGLVAALVSALTPLPL